MLGSRRKSRPGIELARRLFGRSGGNRGDLFVHANGYNLNPGLWALPWAATAGKQPAPLICSVNDQVNDTLNQYLSSLRYHSGRCGRAIHIRGTHASASAHIDQLLGN